MQYTIFFKRDSKLCQDKINLPAGYDLAEAITESKEDLLKELGADKNSLLVARVK